LVHSSYSIFFAGFVRVSTDGAVYDYDHGNFGVHQQSTSIYCCPGIPATYFTDDSIRYTSGYRYPYSFASPYHCAHNAACADKCAYESARADKSSTDKCAYQSARADKSSACTN
jgi:hypothetical protein